MTKAEIRKRHGLTYRQVRDINVQWWAGSSDEAKTVLINDLKRFTAAHGDGVYEPRRKYNTLRVTAEKSRRVA